jgi:TolB-like protein/Tfp pilus assembly protein PilF
MVDLKQGLQSILGTSFTVERELTGGGMSRVFVAMDSALGRRVVVKVLPPELAATVSVERFKREIMLAATLQHPHIVGVLAAGEIDGMPYFTMPFVEGESVRVRIQREGQLTVGRTVSILKDVARALDYAHERGVVHRDIKPDNVLLAGTSATVTDFGIAKALLGALNTDGGEARAESKESTTTTTGSKSALTQLGTTLGTPAYMAPEQAAADPATDHRADIYAFGIMAYEMLTGQVPFKSKTPQALLAAQLTATPSPIGTKRADVPAALARLVMQCLEKEREKRPQSAREIAESLEHPDMVSGAFASASMGAAKRAKRIGWAIGATALVLIAAATWFATSGGFGSAAKVRADSIAAAAAAERAQSIVVMPFVNIGRDSTDDYLADGITNDLINVLSRVSGLRVTSRSAAATARVKYSSSEELGKALGVGRILEGTVQREGRRLRVTARVTNADDGFMVWSDMYERELKDVFAVQDEISASIADALGTQLGATADSLASRGTRDDVAYDTYLRGMHFFEQRGAVGLRRALDYFGQAARKDPKFARAQAGIAGVYSLMPLYTDMSADSAFKAGFAAASRAIQLDSTLAEAYASRALLLTGQWRWSEGESDFQRAIALNARYASAQQWYGEHLMARGRIRDAIEHLKRAADLEPLSPVVASSYSMALAIAKRDAEAVAQARRGTEMDSSLFVPRLAMGIAHLMAKRNAEAVKELESALALSANSPHARGALGYAYGVNGQLGNAQGIAAQLLPLRDGDSRGALAMVQIGMGDTAQALGNLEQAARAHAPLLSAFSLSAPLYDPVRSSGRFRGILMTLGLTP